MFRLFLFFWVMMVCHVQLHAATISGKIVGKDQGALSFASINLLPGNYGTLSNEKGNYSISVPNGTYDIYIRFLGYQSIKQQIVVDGDVPILNFTLVPQEFELKAVDVKAGKEDVAYTIMRKAVAMAKIHQLEVKSYTAQSYVKGTLKVTNIPWVVKKMAKKEGIEENNVYVLESISNVAYQNPGKFSEQVVSIRSNLPPGSNPTINFAQFSFYGAEVGSWVSPLSPKTFSTYRFKYLGAFVDRGETVVKIQVIPISKGPNVFTGTLYLVENGYSVHSVDFAFTDENGFKYTLNQLSSPIEEIWMPVKLDMQADISYLGAKAIARYVTSLRNYKVVPNQKALIKPEVVDLKLAPKEVKKSNPDSLFTTKNAKQKAKEIEEQRKQERLKDGEDVEVVRNYSFKIDSLAREQPDSLWNTLRQMPLDTEEVVAYVKADSLYEANKEKYEKDSLRESGKFFWHSPISGYSYRYGKKINEEKSQFFEYGSPFTELAKGNFYNTVEGLALDARFVYDHRLSVDDRLAAEANFRYSFGRDRFLGNFKYTKYTPKYYFNVSGGSEVTQLNNQNPISGYINAAYSAGFGENFMKLYEKEYLAVNYRRQINRQILVGGSVEVAKRHALENTTNFTFKQYEDRITSNFPDNLAIGNSEFVTHNALLGNFTLVYRPFAKTGIYNDREYTINRGNPTFTLNYLPGYAETLFQKVSFGINQNVPLNKGRELIYAAEIGTFVGQKPQFLIDFHHFNGNQTIFSKNNYQSFLNLDYYRYSANSTYIQGFVQYDMRKFLLTRIPAIQLMGIKESLFVNTLITKDYQYAEFGYRISGLARGFGLDLFTGIGNFSKPNYGVRLKVGF